MNNNLFIILSFALLFSCSQKKENQVQSKDPKERIENNGDLNLELPLKLEVEDLIESEIPDSIEVVGDLILSKKWNDRNGENVLIITRKGPNQETEYEIEFSGDERYAELYGKQYVNSGNGFELLWDIYDFERHCPFDLWIGLIPNSTQITDLDNDGITESTLVYKLTCRSDVSPSSMKLIMHENDAKMGLQGFMILEIDKEKLTDTFEYNLSKIDTTGLDEVEKIFELYGRYNNNFDFKEKPTEFLEFSKKIWRDFVGKDEFLQF